MGAANAPAEQPDRGGAKSSAPPQVGDFPSAAWPPATFAGMRAAIGAPPDFELGLPVEEDSLRRVEEMLLGLPTRRDTARNATTFTSAIPAADPEEYFRVTDLRRHMPDLDPSTERRLGRVLDGGACDLDAIRRQLVRGAAPEAAAAVLELGEIEPTEDRAGYDIAALSLVGPEFAVPVGFKRTDFPSEEWPGVDSLELQGATELVAQLADDLGGIDLSPVPLVSFDQRYAENHQLRRHVRELEFEFVLLIGEDFDEAAGPRLASERQRRLQLMSERMPFAIDGTPPDPMVYSLAVPPADREYLVGLPGTPPEYAIVYPGDPPGLLTGRRGIERSNELVALARLMHPPRVVERLRLLRFLHLNPIGWATAAHLISAYWAACLGRLPPRER